MREVVLILNSIKYKMLCAKLITQVVHTSLRPHWKWKWHWSCELCTDGQMFFRWSSRCSLDLLKSCCTTWSSSFKQTSGVYAAWFLLSLKKTGDSSSPIPSNCNADNIIFHFGLVRGSCKKQRWSWHHGSFCYVTPTSQRQDNIKAASSDGRDLAPSTANRWLQKDRERWAICI